LREVVIVIGFFILFLLFGICASCCSESTKQRTKPIFERAGGAAQGRGKSASECVQAGRFVAITVAVGGERAAAACTPSDEA
jgi:hypothetical protein